MANLLKRDIEDTIWSVLTSFGFNEECDKKGFILDKNEANIINTATTLAKAETVAAVIEAIFAVGNSAFRVTLSNKDVFDLLVLFGFENILRIDETIKDGFSVITDHTEIAFGNFDSDKSTAKININMILRTLNTEDENNEVAKSLAFAEKNAEGVCYDVCYNLRVNGCIVEYYTETGDIKKAEEYAKENGHSCVIRCYSDGKIEIKDFATNDITVTNITDFLGYCNDDDECDCGHDHEHYCDCGHDHSHECSCGHHHE